MGERMRLGYYFMLSSSTCRSLDDPYLLYFSFGPENISFFLHCTPFFYPFWGPDSQTFKMEISKSDLKTNWKLFYSEWGLMITRPCSTSGPTCSDMHQSVLNACLRGIRHWFCFFLVRMKKRENSGTPVSFVSFDPIHPHAGRAQGQWGAPQAQPVAATEGGCRDNKELGRQASATTSTPLKRYSRQLIYIIFKFYSIHVCLIILYYSFRTFNPSNVALLL